MSVIVVKDIGATFGDFKRIVQTLEPLYNDGYGYIVVPPGKDSFTITERGFMRRPDLALDKIRQLISGTSKSYKIALHMRNAYMESDDNEVQMSSTQPIPLTYTSNMLKDSANFKQFDTLVPLVMSSLSPVVDSTKNDGLSEYVLLSEYIRRFIGTDQEKTDFVKNPHAFYLKNENVFLNGTTKLLLTRRGKFIYLPNKNAFHEIVNDIFISDETALRLSASTVFDNADSFPRLEQAVTRFYSFERTRQQASEEEFVYIEPPKKNRIEEIKDQLIIVKNDKDLPFSARKVYRILEVDENEFKICNYCHYFDSEHITGNRDCETQEVKVISRDEVSKDPTSTMHPYHIMYNTTIQK